jgi:aryl-alcohol dehydrogenase-like predicted oxidoreductase
LRDYISLAAVADCARAGSAHHFRFVQLPFNLAMPEAYGLANQIVDKKHVSLLSAAEHLGIGVVGSATLYQGRLSHGLPEFVTRALGMKNDSENAIQFARSAPGLTTSLIGMGHPEHVAAISSWTAAPAKTEDWLKLFSRARVDPACPDDPDSALTSWLELGLQVASRLPTWDFPYDLS